MSFLLLILLSHLNLPALASEEPVVSDSEFEKRLEVKTVYKVKENETPKTIAHFLYGHETWWPKILEDNPKLGNIDENTGIPSGTRILYWAPKVGSTYVVQPNDWLIRIVQWKYGESDQWEEIFEKNSKNIKNPNLIHPGDVLTLGHDGTVTEVKRGTVLVQGVDQIQEVKRKALHFALSRHYSTQEHDSIPSYHHIHGGHEIPVEPIQPIQEEALDPTRGIASHSESDSFDLFGFGFLVGLAGLIGSGLFFWWRQNQILASDFGSAKKVQLPKPKPKAKPAQMKKTKMEKTPSMSDGMRRKPVPDYEIDKSMIHRDQGEIEFASGYELISAQTRKKPIKSK